MITSTGNGKIKELVKLKKSSKERAKRGAFLVEGPKMFREIPRGTILEIYGSESFFLTAEGQAAREQALAGGMEPEVVSDAVFQYLSDTQSPQGILAVVKQLRYELKDLLGRGRQAGGPAGRQSDRQAGRPAERLTPLIVILENLQDPGNLGTILRTAEAAGVSGVLLSQGSADLYNPKVTRSTMGSIFRVPFVYTDDLEGSTLFLKEHGVRVLAAHLKGSVDLYAESFAAPSAILIGNESRGLSDAAASLADQAIRIPMSGSVESLNAAVAAAVCLFEAKRQRRAALPQT